MSSEHPCEAPPAPKRPPAVQPGLQSLGRDEPRWASPLRPGLDACLSVLGQLEGHAASAGIPFATPEWLGPWWGAFGAGEPLAVVVESERGALHAGVTLARGRAGSLAATANVHTGAWGALATSDGPRAELWDRVASLPARRLTLSAMPADGPDVALAENALRSTGFRVVRQPGAPSPFLELPLSLSELLASRSRNLRSQFGRRSRALERRGALTFRTTTGAPRLEEDLDAFLRLEAAGWKGRAGTAILRDARTEHLYRGFARAAADRGWLRLRLLELDGRLVAGDFSVALGGRETLLKTCFDEELAELSPGLVLRGRAFAAAIDEGLRSYDLGGDADRYKLRWTDELRPRVTLHAFRGARTLPVWGYRAHLRPLLKAARDRVRR